MDLPAVAALFSDLDVVELTTWVERGWVQPEGTAMGWVFHEIDVARVRLVHDLRHDMDVGDEALPLVLSLLDQVYELRGTLRSVLNALESQSPELFSAVLASLVHHPTRL